MTKYQKYDAKYKQENQDLTEEYKRLTRQFKDLQEKYRHFEEADEKKFREVRFCADSAAPKHVALGWELLYGK